MKGIKDKISEYERIWEPKITESSESRFWKAVALSYIEQDVESVSYTHLTLPTT